MSKPDYRAGNLREQRRENRPTHSLRARSVTHRGRLGLGRPLPRHSKAGPLAAYGRMGIRTQSLFLVLADDVRGIYRSVKALANANRCQPYKYHSGLEQNIIWSHTNLEAALATMATYCFFCSSLAVQEGSAWGASYYLWAC